MSTEQTGTQQTLMVQGTSSDAGKSLLVTALCRIYARLGYSVAPFKPQNMALNSAVTADGGEIGRAQAVQALAAGLAPSVHFNPVLLKPNSDTGCQVILQGRAVSNMEAEAYHDYKQVAMATVLDSHQRLQQEYSRIIVEGAGSPAEINLRAGDIANMGFAEQVDCPVILIADIDRGGVFAQLVGTLALLSPSERDRVQGFVINKFRGELSLLQSGLDWLEQETGKPVLGVIPYLQDLEIAAEDAIATGQVKQDAKIRVVVPVLPRISNHTDFDSLRLHPDIDLQFIPLHQSLPPCELVILPGSKNVRADLARFQAEGWAAMLQRHLRYGGKVFGICGGYQMLGRSIQDPLGMEDTPGMSKALGLLPIETELMPTKQLTQRQGFMCLNAAAVPVQGYEIHVGQSQVDQDATPLLTYADGVCDGTISPDRQVAGCYLHGILDSAEGLTELMSWLGHQVTRPLTYEQQQLQAIERLADCVEQHLDMAKLEALFHSNWRLGNGG